MLFLKKNAIICEALGPIIYMYVLDFKSLHCVSDKTCYSLFNEYVKFFNKIIWGNLSLLNWEVVYEKRKQD